MKARLDVVLDNMWIASGTGVGLLADGTELDITTPEVVPVQTLRRLAASVVDALCLDGVVDVAQIITDDAHDFEFECGAVYADFCLSRETRTGLLTVNACEPELARAAETIVRNVHAVSPVLQAGIVDPDYNLWQNMDSLSFYESSGRDHAGLPKKPSGAPFPLEEVVIDCSQNAGRRLLRSGYVEFVANPFWISEAWRSRFGYSNEPLPGREWTVLDEGDLTRLSCGANPFRSSSGDEAKRQDELRDYLYGHLEKSSAS